MTKILKILAAFYLVLLLVACGSGRRDARDIHPAIGILVGPRIIAAPVMRIGLIDLASSVVTVKTEGSLVLIDQSRGGTVKTRAALPQISFFVEGASGAGPKAIYRCQVASLTKRESADSLAAKIKRELNLPVRVSFSSQTRTYRVQVGNASKRRDAEAIASRLRKAGHSETWIVSENIPDSGDGKLVAVNAGGRKIAAARVFRCAPRDKVGVLQIGDKAYRGALELRISAEGQVLPVNIVNLEEYLRGVVPAEMSSSMYPQIEALKAQALAARTYAIKNRGQFAGKGYDLVNTARSQVYGGVKLEQEMTDRAIRETRGEIIVYGGKPINAFFTSTCGGHTEDGENIFAGDPEPYLRGVFCTPEAESFSRLTAPKTPAITYGADNLPLNFETTILKVAGVLRESFTPQPQALVTDERLRIWISRTMNRIGRSGKLPELGTDDITLLSAVDLLAEAAGWRERIDKQVSDLDLQTLLDPERTAGLSKTSRKNLIYFLRLGFISTEADGSLAFGESLRQTRLLRMLHRIIDYEGGLGSFEARMVSKAGDKITVELGSIVETFPLDDEVSLFKRFRNKIIPVKNLQIAPGYRL
jgi:hypothetical protein